MHRNQLRQLLDVYADRYPEEVDTTARFRSFIDAHENCFERLLVVGHVTGSAWLVNRAGDFVLLTHHRKLDRWLQLGGHADGESDVAKVALGEAREESGIEGIKIISPELFDVDIHAIPARGAEPRHFHYDCRLALQVTGSEDFSVSRESHDLQWIAIDKLDSVTDEPSMLRMAEKWLK